MVEGERRANLLVVDDDTAFLRLACHHLTRAGFVVADFTDGLKALEHALANPPDLILADIRMPSLDGFGLLVALRANPRTALIPVVFLTAIRDLKAQRKGMRLGADDFLVKPVTRVDLIDAVMSRLERTRVLRVAAARAAVQTDPESWSADAWSAESREHAVTSLAVLREVARAGGYKMLRKLGQGGMSNVYLARELTSARQVVLKIVRFDDHRDNDVVQRFIWEHAILERVSSPYLAALYGHGITDEYAYLAMEYFDGGTLGYLLGAPLSPRRLVELMAGVAAAVASLHRSGIVHCDLKPDNIMLRAGGGMAIVDLGIAVDLEAAPRPLGGTMVTGTPAYMSPEQAMGGSISRASDVYSLGIMFHEMLTGDKPFSGASVQEVMRQHAYAPVPRLPDELRAFQALIDAMLAKSPSQRPPDAGAVLAALEDLVPVAAASTADRGVANVN